MAHAVLEACTSLIFGVLMYSFIPSYRANFLATLRHNSLPVLSANLLNEILYMLGIVSYGLAAMRVPVALVLLTVTFQSIFVFVIAILIAQFIPRLATERIEMSNLAMKAVAICITGYGTFLLLGAR